MRIRRIYGVHPSRCFGRSLGVDPILPPKRCPYNCVYCPMGPTMVKTGKPSPIAAPDPILRELEVFHSKEGCVFDTLYVWGMGDPLLNIYTPLLIGRLHDKIVELGCRPRIIVRTTGFLLAEEWASPALKYSDTVLIPVDAALDLRRIINDPTEGYTLRRLTGIISSLGSNWRRKVGVELNLLKVGSESNSDPSRLAEILASLQKMGVRRVFVKTINRPGTREGLKPVRGNALRRAVEIIEDAGLEPIACGKYGGSPVQLVDSSEEAIYNHVLRKPLSTGEIMAVYGIDGLRNAERLSAIGILEKIPWYGKVFFRARHSIDSFSIA